MSEKSNKSRREFLTGFGALGAGAALMGGVTACSPQQPPAQTNTEGGVAPTTVKTGEPGANGGTAYRAPEGFDPRSAEDNLKTWLKLIGYKKSGEQHCRIL